MVKYVWNELSYSLGLVVSCETKDHVGSPLDLSDYATTPMKSMLN